MTAISVYDRLTETRFILNNKNNQTKYVKQWFSETGQEAVQESDLWEKGTNKVSPVIPEATAKVQGGRAQKKPGSLS